MNHRQLKTVLWLRWRLSQNQLVRSGSFGAVFSAIIASLHIILALAFGLAGIAAGIASGRASKPEILLFVCDGAMALFLFVWLAGLMAELQRSESIDIGKIMHLPVSLRDIFLINYAASHLAPSVILFLPLILGLCFGIVIGAGWQMLLLPVVAIALILAITSWTYCFRGWLSGLMANRRRARAIAVWFTIGLVALAQLPNLAMQMGKFRGGPATKTEAASRKAKSRENVIRAHIFVPPGWLGYSAMMLKRGSQAPAMAALLALALLTVAGLRRGEKLTNRYYTAADASVTKRRPSTEQDTATPAESRRPRRLLVERSVPFVREDTAGLATATLRSLLRAPEVKMALVMPLIVFFVMAGPALLRFRGKIAPEMQPFLILGGLALISLALTPTISNAFGLDRGGFRALVLSPLPRQQILLAKNLAFLPIVLGLNLLVIVVAAFVFHPTVPVLLTTALQALAAFALGSVVSNYLSILTPYRYSMNNLKAKQFTLTTFIAAIASLILAPLTWTIVMIPTLLQYVWTRLDLPSSVPVNLVAALPLVAAATWIFYALLPHQGKLLERRQLAVLEAVTVDLE